MNRRQTLQSNDGTKVKKPVTGAVEKLKPGRVNKAVRKTATDETDSSDKEEISHEKMLHNLIYNENNVLITTKAIRSIVQKYLDPAGAKKNLESCLRKNSKVSDENLPLYQMSLVHDSYVKKNVAANPEKAQNKRRKYAIGISEQELENITRESNIVELQKESYERLEFLGDSVLHLILTDYLFERYPHEAEGFLTRVRAKLENNEQVSVLADRIGLPKYILISKQVESMNGRRNINSWADTFEAFLGALFKDIGYYGCYEFVIRLLEETIDLTELLKVDTNYKDQLMRYYHKMKWGNPTYLDNNSSGEDHQKIFRICIRDQAGKVIGKGSASTKKKAEMLSAKQALKHFGELKEDTSGSEDSSDDDEASKPVKIIKIKRAQK